MTGQTNSLSVQVNDLAIDLSIDQINHVPGPPRTHGIHEDTSNTAALRKTAALGSHSERCVCRAVWDVDNLAAGFVRRILVDGADLFPVFPAPFMAVMAAACTGSAASQQVELQLEGLRAFTHYFDAATALQALRVRGGEVSVVDFDHPVIRAVRQVRASFFVLVYSVYRCG